MADQPSYVSSLNARVVEGWLSLLLLLFIIVIITIMCIYCMHVIVGVCGHMWSSDNNWTYHLRISDYHF